MYPKTGTTIAVVDVVWAFPYTIRIVPTTASTVAKNSRRLTCGSDGMQKKANIITRKGAQLSAIATIVSGKYLITVMLI